MSVEIREVLLNYFYRGEETMSGTNIVGKIRPNLENDEKSVTYKYIVKNPKSSFKLLIIKCLYIYSYFFL
jgi:hypothetical protein